MKNYTKQLPNSLIIINEGHYSKNSADVLMKNIKCYVAYSKLEHTDIETLLPLCLIKEKQKGDTVYYKVDNKKISKLITCLHNYYMSAIMALDRENYSYDFMFNVHEKLAILYSINNIKGYIIDKTNDNKPIFHMYSEEDRFLYIDYNLSDETIRISYPMLAKENYSYFLYNYSYIADEAYYPKSKAQKDYMLNAAELINTPILSYFNLTSVYIYYSNSPKEPYVIIYPIYKTLDAVDAYNKTIGKVYGEINVYDIFKDYDKLNDFLLKLKRGAYTEDTNLPPEKQRDLFELFID